MNESPVEQHGMEIFSLLPSHTIHYLADRPENGTRMSNETLALALTRASRKSAEAALDGMNLVRRERVTEIMAAFASIEDADMERLSTTVNSAVENVLLGVERLLTSGVVKLGEENPENDDALVTADLPRNNIINYSPEGLLAFWVFVAHQFEHRFNPVIDDAINAIEDGFSTGVLVLAMDDLDDARFMAESHLLQQEMTAHHSDTLELVRRGIAGMHQEMDEATLLSDLCDVTPLLFLEKDRLPNMAKQLGAIQGSRLSEESTLAAELMKLNAVFREQGAQALAPHAEAVEDGYLAAGLDMIARGFSADIVAEVMNRRKDTLERDMEMKSNMTLRACLCLREARSARELNEIVGGFLPRPMDFDALLSALAKNL